MPVSAVRRASPAAVDLSATALRKIRSGNAFEATVEQLATAVRLGVFEDGSRLPPERRLAESLGVSRATLREAIAALRQAGLVETALGRGGGTTVVHPIDSGPTRRNRARRAELMAERGEQLRDALVLRRVLEPGAVWLAAQRQLHEDEKALLTAALDAAADAAGTPARRRCDSRLHLGLATVSGSPGLVAAVTEVQRDLHTMLMAIPVLPPNLNHSDRHHARIVRAVLRGEAELARSVMEQHCDDTAALLRGLFGMDHQ